jgi:hypothetical protein
MKNIITLFFILISLAGYSQVVTVQVPKVVTPTVVTPKVVLPKLVTTDENELDEEYTERPFKGQPELKTQYNGLTDEELFILKCRKQK